MATRVRHAPPRTEGGLLPVRMLTQFVYCPRLFHLEHVQGYFVESADTVEGSGQHRRAARRGRTKSTGGFEETAMLPEALQMGSARQLVLESEALGVRGTFDLLELKDGAVAVVEAKHGAGPQGTDHTWDEHRLPYRAWPADVVQVGLYMALLREVGVRCDQGIILYRKNRQRVEIPWSAELERFLHRAVRAAREVEAQTVPPAPLVSSPKCRGCSLNPVCLPDEYYMLRKEDAYLDTEDDELDDETDGDEDGKDDASGAVAAEEPSRATARPLPSGDDRVPLHVLTPGAVVGKSGETLSVRFRNGTSETVRIKDISQVALYGQVHVTEPCMRHLLLNDISVAHHTGAGRLVGLSLPLQTRNVALRRGQYRAADDDAKRLEAARAWVVAKIRNQRTLLRRYRQKAAEHGASLDRTIEQMKVAWSAATRSRDIDKLRGHEGDAAALYFGALAHVLPQEWREHFSGRSRRPPRDPVNALLSFGYSLLARESAAAVARVGLDPMLGLFHTMIAGRPALALDVMEPFRPSWVDATILRLLANGSVRPTDFLSCGDGVYLTDRARRAFVKSFERRGDEVTTHPYFGYQMSYRRLLELEVRVLAKWMIGEIEALRPLVTR